ncbi:MAG: NAD-dependent epimerase/dehydratase family protein [bacterium]
MRILLLGADGYLGWPTAMHLANEGHEVMAVDNYLRRDLSRDYDVEPLIILPNLNKRAGIFEKITGKKVDVRIGDCCDYQFLSSLFKEFEPDAIVHYAEQPSAPFSMIGQKEADLTLRNNLTATHNIIFCMLNFAPGSHMVKIGTMGEYGTPNIDIEEGWLKVEHKGRKETFLFPRQAGSLYHTTKIMDTDLLWFYARTYGLRFTDLMQGPVYGLHTKETRLDDSLLPIFNYDDVFGTVLNRFLVQAVKGHPLTVYGKGGQTRGYLNIIDTLECVKLSVLNPPENGQLRIFNQLTETFTVNELAEKVKKAVESLGLNVKIQHLDNPRKEAEEHYYNPTYTGLKELGLKPNYLTDDVIKEMLEQVMKYKDNIDESNIMPRVRWKK